MRFQTERLGTHMAAAVIRLDLNRRPDATTRAALLEVLHDNLVLCIRDQKHTPECAEVNIISSEDRDELGDGRKIVNGASWHTDDSFMREPCSLTMLYGVVVPSRDGDTQFTNMYAAYADLPAETKARMGAPLQWRDPLLQRQRRATGVAPPAEEHDGSLITPPTARSVRVRRRA